MKRRRTSTFIAAAACLLIVILIGISCNKDVLPGQPLAALTPTNNDANAGSWKMIVLTGPTQISVAPPASTSDPSYTAELAAIKASQAKITDAQKTSLASWSGSGVLRWNEILRSFVAQSDLPPEPNANGTYPAPDPNNPFAFPQYPFGNPPYAARAYSYVAVAQYEALKVAWYYKYQYNRPSPSKVDSMIHSLMPTTDLPSYPSEDAVVAGVTVPLLKALFPTEATQIDQYASEQEMVVQLAGKASASDVAAGLALGQAVSKIILARAGTDGMKAAAGTTAQWQAIASTVAATGETPWVSQEIPARPPMLPFFGKVKAWMMTPTDIVNERPGPPPSTSSAEMGQQTAMVKQTLANITSDQLAIAQKWQDGVSTTTPPGHWNTIAVPYISQAKFSEVRAARALALLDMALHDAAVGCWDTKYTYYNPRPEQMDPTIKTVIGLPNFPSYTSGHSTFSAAAAEVLSYLFPQGATSFAQMRDEAAMSRLYGGIHYPVDNEVGKDHGKRIGDYTVRFAQQDGADQ